MESASHHERMVCIMCGFAGVLCNGRVSEELLTAMTSKIRHRGPDDHGVWFDQDAGIGLGHNRLFVLDPSPAGHQPMISTSGRYVIGLNGEIYNHSSLRSVMKEKGFAPQWRGHSDTETLLAGFDAWGIEATIQKTVSMFAFAAWDQKERSLTLARDRLGEKPLYYGWNRGVFLFASELKALSAYPGFDAAINHNALALFLRHGYIPAPYSIYRGIFKLLPGHTLTLRKEACNICPWDFDEPPFESFQAGSVSLHTYWALGDAAEKGQRQIFTGTDTEAASEFENVLTAAVLSQQISDVPLGAFLSGGVDSSAIVALMQSHSSQPVKTFSIGFREDDYNEAKFAKDVALHLGTDHTELYVTPDEAMAVIPRLPLLYDEPFADSSQIPTFLLSQLARQFVTVCLSGDAGDELLGGYDRYFLSKSIWEKIGWFPRSGRHALGKTIMKIPVYRWDQLNSLISNFHLGKRHIERLGDRAHKLAEILTAPTPEALYFDLISQWRSPCDIVCLSFEPLTTITNYLSVANVREFQHRMMLLDAISYLPDDILVKVDRAAMGVGLETRVPFLDHRVVEFLWRLPINLKIRNGQGKWLLRQLLNKYIPQKLIKRPKMGFAVPIAEWLRDPLRDWAEALLNESRLKREGFFNTEPIRLKWSEHLSGFRNWEHHLWDILMFQAWLAEQRQ